MVISLIIGILIFNYVLEILLEFVNSRKWSNKLPSELAGIYNEDKYKLSQEYDRAKKRFSLVTGLVNLLIMLVLLLSGSFALLDKWAISTASGEIKSTLLFFVVLAFLADMISLPFSMYRIFVIEDRFGFNRTTLKIFFSDKIKGYLLGGVLGGSLLALFVIFYKYAGDYFWIYAWITITLVLLFTTMFYATWILPLFNKLKPLPEGELRSEIEKYCNVVGFKVSNLFVMDGSKRSAKANAFFSGIGRKKRIVLFDTLIENHTTPELIAILAHEIGHYKKKHTLTALVMSVLQTGLMLFVFSKFINSPALSEAFGSSTPSLRLGMLGFVMLYSPISMIMGIVMNIISRKNEFEADLYASETSNGVALQESLKKLSVNNLSNLQPHPLYVFFYYSHPPLLQRLKALQAKTEPG